MAKILAGDDLAEVFGFDIWSSVFFEMQIALGSPTVGVGWPRQHAPVKASAAPSKSQIRRGHGKTRAQREARNRSTPNGRGELRRTT